MELLRLPVSEFLRNILRSTCTILIIASAANSCFSQGVGINSSGNSPDPSAALDVDYTNKGVLITRMTTEQRDAIPDPALGLLVFNTSTNCINMWLGTTWKKLCGECDFQNPIPGSNGPVCEGDNLILTATSVGNGASYQWSGPGGFVSSDQNPTIAGVTTELSGSYSVVATLDGCASAPQSIVVAVNPIPDTPVASNSGAVWCNSTVNLQASSIPNADYEWTGPSGFNSDIQNPSIENAQLDDSGTYSVVAEVNGCVSEVATTEVIINSPVASFTHSYPSWPQTAIAFNPDESEGDTYSWVFENGSPANSSSEVPSVTWNSTGTYEVELTVTRNGCSASSSGTIMINNPIVTSFTSVGTTMWTAPEGVTSVEYLVVAGGGGGGYWSGGGGGAGGVLMGTIPVTGGNEYSIVVGAGGSGGVSASSTFATNGGNSSFASVTAIGGGAGGSYSTDLTGHNGGSGGGGNYTASGGLGTSGQGNNGGHTISLGGPCYPSGSGGGAGAPGNNGGSGCIAPNGGNGVASSITGVSVYYGGGGAGGQDTSRSGFTGAGSGGLGGGGNSSTATPGHASPNTGGGGGGGGNSSGSWTFDGGNGGSGIVILKY